VKDFFECLVEYLLSINDLQEVIGNKLYPNILPQESSLPAIVYTPISASYDESLQGSTGFVRQVVQFSIHDTTFGKARQASRIVKAILQDFRGDMCGLFVQATHILSDLSIDRNSKKSFDVDEYTSVLEFSFEYTE